MLWVWPVLRWPGRPRFMKGKAIVPFIVDRFMGKHHIWGHFSIAQNVWGIWNMAWRGIWGSSSIRGEISLSSPSLAPTLTAPCNFFDTSTHIAFDWIILEKSKNNCTLIHAFHYMWNIFYKLFVYFFKSKRVTTGIWQRKQYLQGPHKDLIDHP